MDTWIKKKCKIKCINGLFVISGDREYRGTVGKGHIRALDIERIHQDREISHECP